MTGDPFEVDGRPAPAPRAPPRTALLAVYSELLAIERERLAVAVRIEKERGFVFPETSVIVRDVRFLAEKVYGSASTAEDARDPTSAGPPSEDDELDALLDELGAEGADLGEP